jgi:hypothetical protein
MGWSATIKAKPGPEVRSQGAATCQRGSNGTASTRPDAPAPSLATLDPAVLGWNRPDVRGRQSKTSPDPDSRDRRGRRAEGGEQSGIGAKQPIMSYDERGAAIRDC